MRALLVAAILPALFAGNVANAQMAVMTTPTPTIGATSPLGDGVGSPVSQTGIPFGATELSSAGVSPLAAPATGTIAIPSNGAVCSTVGSAPAEMFGSAAMFDGGGTGAGSAAPATAGMAGTSVASPGMAATISPTSALSAPSATIDTSGMSGMCGSGSSSVIASSTPTSISPITMGGVPRTGISLDSSEISNAGVSSAAPIPTPGVAPFASPIESAVVVPTMPSLPASNQSIPAPPTLANGCPLISTGSITSTLPAGC